MKYVYLIKEPESLLHKASLCSNIALLSILLGFRPLVTLILIVAFCLPYYGHYKIGVSKNVGRRIAELKTGNYRELKVICKAKYKQSYEQESCLHQFFKSQNKNREWFRLWFWQVLLIRFLFWKNK